MSYSAFVQARDFLLAHRTDYETAYRDFAWPQLDALSLGWALATHNVREFRRVPGLRVEDWLA